MKIAIFNHVHPAASLVSALRMREFANMLAALGDRVVFLTGTLDTGDPGDAAADVAKRLSTHDWSTPLHLACRPVATPLRRAAREGRIVSPFRQAVIGNAYLTGSGIFSGWRQGVAAMYSPLAQEFAPDATYGTFGNTDTWMAARDLAQRAGCPWVADYKDPWERFVPVGLRKILARRLSGMAAITAFSHAHLRDAERWFACEKHVVYSGYTEGEAPVPTGRAGDALHVCLSGSLYRPDVVRTLIEGLNLAAASRPIKLSYAGHDGAGIRGLTDHLSADVAFEDLGYLTPDALLALQKSAGLNVYVRNPHSLFQQKLIELLAAGRPVMSVPDESAEAGEIAEDVKGVLIRAGTPAEIAHALLSPDIGEDNSVDPARMRVYAWRSQAERLRGILAKAAGISL